MKDSTKKTTREQELPVLISHEKSIQSIAADKIRKHKEQIHLLQESLIVRLKESYAIMQSYIIYLHNKKKKAMRKPLHSYIAFSTKNSIIYHINN